MEVRMEPNTDANQSDSSIDQSVNNSIQADELKKEDDKEIDPKDSRIMELASEAKKYRQQLAQIKREKEAQEKKQLEEQGEYKKMYESVNEELSNYKTAIFRGSEISAFKDELVKQGCNDPKKIELLLSQVNLDEVELDEGHKPNLDQVAFQAQKLKNEHIYLFQKAAPKVAVGTPGTPNLEPKSWTEVKDKTELLKAALRRENG